MVYPYGMDSKKPPITPLNTDKNKRPYNNRQKQKGINIDKIEG